MTKVAVIGCGPGGMFFLHAIALRRKRLALEGNSAAIAALPEVTCFERSSSPGGVWKSDASNKDGAKSTKMYEGLWTNGPKECIEFFDYTFDEHFGCALPTYLPRALVLDYIMARCTRDNSNLFDDVKFSTSVQSVNFSDNLRKFVVQTMDNKTKVVKEDIFDKCIWAGGTNGKPIIPDNISKVLSSGGYKGAMVHSSETGSSFDQLVCHKNILLIGDSYSAEDLSLQAIKLGVETVDICSRSGNGITSFTGAWPMDKVHVHIGYKPIGVADDGYGIILSDGTEELILNDIETVIYCTGYRHNFSMLHPSIRPSVVGPYFTQYKIPNDWKMPLNAFSKEFGDIPIGRILDPSFVEEDVYRGRLISNPNMMFIWERAEIPLMDLEIGAWLLLAQISGDISLPSVKEMKRFNLETLIETMKDPMCRENDEENYKNRMSLVEDNHWSCDTSDERVVHMNRNYIALGFRMLARDMQDINYPLQIGTFTKLNEKGRALVEMNMVCDYARFNVDHYTEDASWRTFRDCNPSQCYSIITGTKAVPLKCHWIDIDSLSKDDIVDTTLQRKKCLIRIKSNGGEEKKEDNGDSKSKADNADSKKVIAHFLSAINLVQVNQRF